jgi:hypothetical protein
MRRMNKFGGRIISNLLHLKISYQTFEVNEQCIKRCIVVSTTDSHNQYPIPIKPLPEWVIYPKEAAKQML